MAWLGTYTHRRSITVSDTNIDSNQTHLPVRLNISTSSGTGSTDISSIFDELQSDENRNKIAITLGDGTTQIYGEIEKWDDANETAELWISKSDWVLYASATGEQNILYFYYDDAQDANTTYVADSGSRTEVWDSNFKMVQHLTGAAYTDLDDATSNNNDVTGESGNPTYNSAGKIAKSVDYDGDDYNEIADIDVNHITLSVWIKTTMVGDYGGIIGEWNGGIGSRSFTMWKYIDGTIYVAIYAGASDTYKYQVGDDVIDDGNWHKIEMTWDGTTINLYIDNVLDNDGGSAGTGSGNIYDANQVTRIGHQNDNTARWFIGSIDEPRISTTVRSNDWRKVNYYSETDALVAWGVEEDYSAGVAYTKTLTETLSVSDSLKKSPTLLKNEALSISESVQKVNAFSKSLSETMSVSESTGSIFGKMSSDSLAFTESLVKLFGLKTTEALTFVESLSSVVGRQATLSDAFTLTESQRLHVAKIFTDTMSISEDHTYEMPVVIRHILHIGP